MRPIWLAVALDAQPVWSRTRRRAASDLRVPLGVADHAAGVVPKGPRLGRMGPMAQVEFERVEALELLAMTLAHLNMAETRSDLSPRVPLLMAIRDKLALALREES